MRHVSFDNKPDESMAVFLAHEDQKNRRAARRERKLYSKREAV